MSQPRARMHAPRRFALAAVVTGLVVLASVPTGAARSKPTCFGKTATIVGSNGPNHISGTAHKDVIVALGGRDVIKAPKGPQNNGQDVICAGGGNDYVKGDTDDEKISGGPGNDYIESGNGNDLVVGDNANVSGDESGETGRDHLDTSGGIDFVVGDNYARGDASGASPEFITTSKAGDTIIGDDASFGGGNATGHADDPHLAGASGDDRVIGDSYTVSGIASGGGNDEVDGGPGADLQVGDGYTVRGTAADGGRDELHAADGGDFDETCHPANSCADVFYGDNYRAACAANRNVAANAKVNVIRCVNLNTEGGKPDKLTSDQGDDFMDAGLPHPDPGAGSGDTVDQCDGGSGHDIATSCKGIKRGFQKELPFPLPLL
jgi:hypothetical protein